jgi:DNA-binding CsgD family transcriptional regulator
MEGVNQQPDELRRLSNLVALLLVKGESQTEKIRTLAAAGYPPNEIASLLGTTANSVSVTLHKLRRKRR